MIVAGEDFGLFAASLDGTILWRHPARHCGEACVGKFYSDRPGLQILGNDEAWRLGASAGGTASYMLDGQGAVIWTSDLDRYAKPIPWPTTLGPQAMLAKPHAAEPADARPFIMDGAGTLLAEFDIPRTLAQYKEFALPHTGPVWGDWGDYYGNYCEDLDGSGPRLIISTRRDLWVFSMQTR
jgi:hypothetical protein